MAEAGDVVAPEIFEAEVVADCLLEPVVVPRAEVAAVVKVGEGMTEAVGDEAV